MIINMELILVLIFCHLIGDYVLQTDFIARSKGHNIYHLLVHCILYLVPFYVAFGFHWILLILFISHWFIDLAKAGPYRLISYRHDQIGHYFILIIIYSALV